MGRDCIPLPGWPHWGDVVMILNFGKQGDITNRIAHAEFSVSQFGHFGGLTPDTPKSAILQPIGLVSYHATQRCCQRVPERMHTSFELLALIIFHYALP